MDTKTCTKCGETKPLSAFYKNGSRIKSICKQCEAAYRAANKDKLAAYYAARYVATKDEYAAYWAAYRAASKGKKAAYDAAYRKANRDKLIAHYAATRKAVHPWYAAQTLGIPAAELTPELLELKRQKIELHRLQRQLQQTLKDLNHDERTEPEPAECGHLPDLRDVDNG